jgi:hypothetical protein
MALKKTATDVAAMATDDGHAVIGAGRSASTEFYETLNRQQSGLPPAGAIKARNPQPAPVTGLVSLGVARQILAKRIAELRQEADGLGRSIAAHPAQFAGNGNPYLQDVMRAHQAMTVGYRQQLEVVKDELGRLESMDDSAAQAWAGEYLATHPGRIRGGAY